MVKTLKKLRKEVPRRFKDLRKLCDDMIAFLTEENKSGVVLSSRPLPYLEPFILACESRQPRLMEIGLDGLNYLIEHGYLKGSENFAEVNDPFKDVETDADGKTVQKKNNGIIDTIIEVVSKCSDEYDDVVQLQVVKVILTAVTSSSCEVHEGSLLLSVRSCFHIHLISKNQVNKTTAKAALTQMISVVNLRMESHDAAINPIKSAVDSNEDDVLTNEQNIEDTPINSDDNKPTSDVPSSSQPVVEEIIGDDHKLESEEPTHTHTQSETESSSTNRASVTGTGGGDDDGFHGVGAFSSHFHKDAFLIFRALCKLSMKGLEDDANSANDPIALQNKILSLELIYYTLQHCGPTFQTEEKIIGVVRNYLCVSLLGNCTSNVAQVTGLSLQIFATLLEFFKDHLKSELEVFVTGIFLRILESENSTYEHKLRVLEVFHNICKDPAALVELFINYDCDLEAIDLFRRIVDGFAKVAKNPQLSQNRMSVEFMSSSGKRSVMEEQHVRVMGLEGVVIVLLSMLKSGGINNSKISSPEPPPPSSSSSLSSSVAYSIDDDSALESTHGTSNVVDAFDRKQKIQEEIESGILKFNLSSKKGLVYLSNLGHVSMNAKSVASFLLQYHDRLDKVAVGEYLGREREYENGFCLKVLHEYVDSMNFESMAFDIAIRHFLSFFRLPGEAQKIDRIMEKFAERYYLQNRDKFASADMAFILAFSTIMLQTNLHNPAIRDDKRMTKEQFLKQNKGISSDGEIPDDVLSDIYDRIAAEPITISNDDKINRKAKKDDSAFGGVFPISFDKKRKDAFNNERKEMVRAGEALFKQKNRRGTLYVRKANQSDEMYIRPMFEVVWAPIMGVLSQVLEVSEEPNAVSLCLTGFQYAIRLACRFDFPVARDTYINALAKFTTLDTVREMHHKNIECIKTLLEVSLTESDYIDESWRQILQSISLLSRLQLFAGRLHTDEVFFNDLPVSSSAAARSTDVSNNGRRGSQMALRPMERQNSISTMGLSFDPFKNLFSGPSRAEIVRNVEESNAEMILREISPSIIDQIFMNSQILSEQSVLHFVKCLCEVSLLEINTSSSMNSLRGRELPSDAATPRIFCLQRLVEVADFNMHTRPRIAWANIWNRLASHFTAIGMNENHALAMYAMDSLKQLSIKFLQKDELSNFSFQRVFLRPFEIVISKSKALEIKDLILRCIDIMIRACAPNIRSGWRTIFAILEVAAGQENPELSSLSFDIIERLMTQQFDLLIFDFVELMNCLVAFVAGPHLTVALKSLTHLSKCADHLAEGKVSPALNAQHLPTDSMGISWEKSKKPDGPIEIGEDASVFRLWWPLLLGLSTRVSDNRVQVRSRALETLRSVLNLYGHIFSPQTWSVIFKGVLFPMIDSAKTDFTIQPVSKFPSENPPASTNQNSWIGTMGQPVLSVCLDLYLKFQEKEKTTPMLPDLLTMLEGCICQDTEILAKMGLKAFLDLMLSLSNSNDAPANLTGLSCSKMKSCILNNFCLNFGEIGVLEFIPETPDYVKQLIGGCPLSRRRGLKEDNTKKPSDLIKTSIVSTSFGIGKLLADLPATTEEIPLRHCISLPWGILYTTTDYSSSQYSELEVLQVDNTKWNSIASPVMTSMVLSLDSIRVFGEIISSYFGAWTVNQFSDILSSFEVLYWHSRSFNANITIRKQLHARKFMVFPDDPKRFPHLLEQEVFSLSKILEISTKLYNQGDSIENRKFAAPWVKRIVSMACERYLSLEAILESSSTPYNSEEHDAYGAAVLIALHGVLGMDDQQFQNCLPWFASTLSRMVMCDDVDVRSCVSTIYSQRINPLLIAN